MRRPSTTMMAFCVIAFPLACSAADKPNILVIWGDDIGWYNFSCYHQGMMGGRTPNIDRVAKRGRPVHRLLRVSRVARPVGPRSSRVSTRFAPA